MRADISSKRNRKTVSRKKKKKRKKEEFTYKTKDKQETDGREARDIIQVSK